MRELASLAAFISSEIPFSVISSKAFSTQSTCARYILTTKIGKVKGNNNKKIIIRKVKPRQDCSPEINEILWEEPEETLKCIVVFVSTFSGSKSCHPLLTQEMLSQRRLR